MNSWLSQALPSGDYIQSISDQLIALSSCVQILSQVMSQSNYFNTGIECGALRHKRTAVERLFRLGNFRKYGL